MPAIAGLAHYFGEHNDAGRYLFGIWSKSLDTGLLWVEVNKAPEEVSNGYASGCAPPSWSWARWKGSIVFPRPTPNAPLFKVVKGSLEPNTHQSTSTVITRAGILSLWADVMDLLEVRATPNAQPPGSSSFDPAVSVFYKVTSRDSMYASWVSFDGK